MYRLERPNMALNDPRVCDADGHRQRYIMQNTWDIFPNETRKHMVEWVAHMAGEFGGKIKNLVLNCHGNSAYLALGEGVSAADVPDFAPWKGLVEKIWLPDCLVASGDAGDKFCKDFSKTTGAYVVAPTEIQCDTLHDVPREMMTSWEGEVRSYNPDGTIGWVGKWPSVGN